MRARRKRLLDSKNLIQAVAIADGASTQLPGFLQMCGPLAQIDDEAFLALGFGAKFEHTLLPEQFHRKLGGDFVGDLRFSFLIKIVWTIFKNQGVTGLVEFDEFAVNAGRERRGTVFEIVDGATKQWLIGE